MQLMNNQSKSILKEAIVISFELQYRIFTEGLSLAWPKFEPGTSKYEKEVQFTGSRHTSNMTQNYT
jgi:hypothetical protein